MSKFIKMVSVLIFIILAFAYLNSTVQRSEESFLGFGSELDSVAIKPDTKIAGVRDISLPLREYCMFASYNTAITGTRANMEMITNVLNRGCRFMDLEIYSVKDMPVVGFSTEMNNTIPLSDVLNKISSIGFSETPNPNDPIFINLRVKTNNKELYGKIAVTIQNSIGLRLYKNYDSNMITKPLSVFMKKVVILLDDTIQLPANNNLLKYANLVLNKNNVRSYSAPMLNRENITPPYPSGNRTNPTMLKIVYPSDYENSKFKKFFREYGAQVILNRFYKPDNNLTETEKIFSDVGSAFVPMAQMWNYFKMADA